LVSSLDEEVNGTQWQRPEEMVERRRRVEELMKRTVEDTRATLEGIISEIFDSDYEGKDIQFEDQYPMIARWLVELPFIAKNNKVRITVELIK
jgi:hypothetical protein